MKKIILASTSPRRRELLKQLGMPFKAVASNYHEIHHAHLKPVELVKFLAKGKAEAAAKKHKGSIIIGADTIVARNGKVYGKPKDKKDALKMLLELGGKSHYVYTAVCIIDTIKNKRLIRAVKTKVVFRKLNPQGVKDYIATGEPMDKAGAYAIQGIGSGLIKGVQGDYTNVVGLPLDVLKSMLEKFKLKIRYFSHICD